MTPQRFQILATDNAPASLGELHGLHYVLLAQLKLLRVKCIDLP